jgi:hypothetical protein
VNLTLENLNAKGACATGLEWITPILGDADVWDRLVTEHPEWAQWAVGKGFTHEISEPVWARMGCVLAGSQLVFAQTAGGGSHQTAGYRSTQTAGGYSTQTAGDYSTQTAGDYSTQTAGGYSTQTAGYESTQTAGGGSHQTAGDYSTQTAGYESTQTAGGYSTQTAGYESTQTAGGGSHQTAGDYSTQTAGGGSHHKAGVGSVFVCRYYKDGWQVAVTINPDPNFYWTYDIERGEWVHAEDQSETQVAGS